MRKLISLAFLTAFASLSYGDVLVSYTFPSTNSLTATVLDSNLSATDVAVGTSLGGTITTNLSAGAFPNNPHISVNTGWTATTQATAQSLIFTLTADSGFEFSITSISFNCLSVTNGPTGIGISINGGNQYEQALSAFNTLVSVNQSFTQTALTSVTIEIQGWKDSNSALSSGGGGQFRIDDLTVNGTTQAVPEASTFATIAGLASLGTFIVARRRKALRA